MRVPTILIVILVCLAISSGSPWALLGVGLFIPVLLRDLTTCKCTGADQAEAPDTPRKTDAELMREFRIMLDTAQRHPNRRHR